MVVAWLMRERGMPLLQAVKHCKSAKATVAPNDSFKLALANYELALVGTTSVASTHDPFWNFYAWNRVKHGHPKSVPGRAAIPHARGGGRRKGRGGAAGAVVVRRSGGVCGGTCGACSVM